jgi:hypothetical protein
MASPSDEQLKWMAENRNGWIERRFPKPVGAIADDVVRANANTASDQRRRIIALLDEHFGEALTRQIEVGRIRRGVLTLYVADPAFGYNLRVHWEQPLLALLRSELPGAGLHSVRFTTGKAQ